MPPRSRKDDKLTEEQADPSRGKRVVRGSAAKKAKKSTAKKVQTKKAKKIQAKKAKKIQAKKVKKVQAKQAKKVKVKKVRAKVSKKAIQNRVKKAGQATRTAAEKPKSAQAITESESDSGFRWLSVSAEEGAEIQVAKALARVREIREVLLPVHDGAALYPGYVFVDCDRSDDDVLCGICQIDAVEGILARDGVFNYAVGGHEPPVELEETALRSIRDSCSRYARRARGEMVLVEKGQQIIITTGVFSGMTGEILSVNRRKMSVIAKVRLSDGGMVRKVSVKHGQFETTEEKEDDGWRL